MRFVHLIVFASAGVFFLAALFSLGSGGGSLALVLGLLARVLVAAAAEVRECAVMGVAVGAFGDDEEPPVDGAVG